MTGAVTPRCSGMCVVHCHDIEARLEEALAILEATIMDNYSDTTQVSRRLDDIKRLRYRKPRPEPEADAGG